MKSEDVRLSREACVCVCVGEKCFFLPSLVSKKETSAGEKVEKENTGASDSDDQPSYNYRGIICLLFFLY